MDLTIQQDIQANYLITQLLEESKESSEEILDRLPDLFMIIDATGRILKTNSVLRKFIKMDDEELLNRIPCFLFKNETWVLFETQLRGLTENENCQPFIEFELPLDGIDNQKIAFIWHIRPFESQISSVHNLFCVIARDISISKLLKDKNDELAGQKNKIELILNSSSQGFLTYNSELEVEKEVSLRAFDILGKDIVGKNICDVLQIKKGGFEGLSRLVFEGRDDSILKDLSVMDTQVNGRYLRCEITPIFQGQKVIRILATVTDITQINNLKQSAEASARESRSIIKILKAKDVFLSIVGNLNSIEKCPEDTIIVQRLVHTLKGEFGMFECQDQVNVCSSWEDSIASGFSKEQNEKFLDQLKDQIKKLLDKYDRILQFSKENRAQVYVSVERVKNSFFEITKDPSPENIQLNLEGLLEQDPSEFLNWLNEAWLLAAKQLNKEVEPIQWLTKVSIFPIPYQKLFSSLVHLVRNSADHGIEAPEQRVSSGKRREGTLTAELELVKDFYHLRFKDNGSGAQIDKIKERALKQGLTIPQVKEELINLIFEANFSTSDVISVSSGRGVGLNAIKAEANALGGSVTAANIAEGGLEIHIWFKKVPNFKPA